MSGMRTLRLAPNGAVPNNPGLPVLIVPGAFDPDLGADGAIRTMEGNGWGGTWRWTVFDYHHYHPDAHEALAVSRGWAELVLGGAGAERVRVAAGDLLVLPAGTGHCRVESGDGFEVCGAYPQGQEGFTTVRADEGRAFDRDAIAAVPLPRTDPVAGADGPLPRAWGPNGAR